MPVFVTLYPEITKSIPPQGMDKSLEVQICLTPSVKGIIIEMTKDSTTNYLKITVKGATITETPFGEAIANITSNTKIYDERGHPLKISD